MKLSIVVPCYNEELNVVAFHNQVAKVLREADYEYEIVFVNDGSRDKTLEKVREISSSDKSIYYLSFSRNFGKEAAMLAGISHTTGDYIIFMDCDLQHPPELIPAMMEKGLEGFDQVIAKRDRKGEKLHRSILARLYYFTINRLIEIEINNGEGDFRLLSRRAANSLLELQEYNRFSKGLFSWIGYKQVVITYQNVVREIGQSAWTFRKLLNYGIDGLVSFNNKPLRIAIYMGFSTFLVSCLYLVYIMQQIFQEGIEVPGYFTTICAILLIGGIQLIFMGVIGEYIGRIYYETKKRPHFIIEESNIKKNMFEKNDVEDMQIVRDLTLVRDVPCLLNIKGKAVK